MSDRQGVGQRVAQQRKLRGMTQAALARRTGFSTSTISKVERGQMPASEQFVALSARELRVPPVELLGQPRETRHPTDRETRASVADLRRALVRYDAAPEDDVVPRSVDELAAEVATVSAHRHAARLDQVGALVPGLLTELRRAAERTSDASVRERVYGLMAEAYYAAGQMLYKLGYADLSSLAVDRYEWAAARSGDELAVLVGHYQRAGELIVISEWAAALSLLDRSRAHLVDGDEYRRSPAATSVWGNLHLKSALALARSGDLTAADEHWREAQEAAQLLGEDRDDYRLAFGPTNVAIWSVSLAVEAGDATSARVRAQKVRVPRHAPAERVGRYWIDLGRAALLDGDREHAVACLHRAREVSPQQTRHHPMVHETLRVLATSRRGSDPVARLATWAGVSVG
ncbi:MULTISPECIES: helix-turn-helix domain-containing protein [Actinoalloteichus]|uniref:helix-turn-helix domain-containing protein n=1 Tax=Actinoalloteichus TaxID=65496 RepID=UPI000585A47E|nr:helix-turn-helix transcriptional regulator [Actinoalloteichus spitiensis]